MAIYLHAYHCETGYLYIKKAENVKKIFSHALTSFTHLFTCLVSTDIYM